MLVLDDVQELTGGDASCRLLGDFVRSGPARLHVVLSSRHEPPFPVARLRAQGLTLDVPGDVLRFIGEETAAVVAGILGGGPDADAVASVLHEATAGWPAAVRLLAESLRTAPADLWTARVQEAADVGGQLESTSSKRSCPSRRRASSI